MTANPSSPRSETEFYVGNRFFALCTSSVSKILRAGTFCPYSVRLSVRLSVCLSVPRAIIFLYC
jgi:hypothetical protein